MAPKLPMTDQQSGSEATGACDKEFRQRVVVLLAKCFSASSQGLPQTEDRKSPESFNHIAAEIEAALYAQHDGYTSEGYRQTARMLRTNLGNPQNLELRKKVLSGELAPPELCRLDSKSLAPPEVRNRRLRDEQICLNEAWDREGPLPLQPYEGLDSTNSSYRNASAPPPPPKRRCISKEDDGNDEESDPY
eukprot:TRINITY_DN6618_c0_g2_i1.p1 TRINITY_DN6618_c0_g2~~TRINITY_DN6618_c0_g2_i1.p1  ORF type:complete len:191 (+),score=29.26 TRINITY_DN6618_c0_g2_i1:200-772(+)